MKKYDIFISYRRAGGFEMGEAINQRLINAGYSVFLDIEQLNHGKFNTKLLSVIEQCRDFILILPPGALDRCNDENDWVRKEVEQAIAHDKNIIPIMLAGFEWPPIDTLPESMRLLPLYNGISATDHNVFVENIERLKKNFLQSRPGVSWRRHKKIFIAIITLTIVLSAIFGALYIHDTMQYRRVCDKQAMLMMNEFAKMHHNLALAESVNGACKAYTDAYGGPEAAIECENLQTNIAHNRKQLQRPAKIPITDAEADIMRRHGVPMEDFVAFEFMVESFYNEVTTYISNVDTLTQISLSATLVESVGCQLEFLQSCLRADYYGLLAFYTAMPSSIYDDLYKVIPQLTYVAGIPLSLSADDYISMSESEMTKMEQILDKMGGSLQRLKLDIDAKEQFDKALSALLDSMEAPVKQVQCKIPTKHLSGDDASEIKKHKDEIRKIDEELSAMYRADMKRYALSPSDDQGLMWGKILRMARLAEITMTSENVAQREHAALVARAEAQGNSIENLILKKSITAQDKYENVDRWLLEYQRLNPADDPYIADCVAAARAYYRAVAENRQDPSVGIILSVTKDNLRHPVYCIGDIVIACDGNAIHTADDYFAIVSGSETSHRVQLLRLVDDVLTPITVNLPPHCEVLTGFSSLHEE